MKTQKSTPDQRKLIHQLCRYDAELKQQIIIDATDGRTATSREISIDEASDIINRLCNNWAKFDKENSQHRYILSLLHQLGWVDHSTGLALPDLDRLSYWLKSKRCPINKPIKAMTTKELTKVINALESMTAKAYAN